MSFNNCIIWNNIALANSWKERKRRREDEGEERACSEIMDVPLMCNVIIFGEKKQESIGGRKTIKWMDESGNRWIEVRVRGSKWRSEKGKGKADGARKRLGWFNLFAGLEVAPFRPLWQAEGIWQTDQNYNLMPFSHHTTLANGVHVPAHLTYSYQWCLWIYDNSWWSLEGKLDLAWLWGHGTTLFPFFHPEIITGTVFYDMKEPTLKYSISELLMYPEFKCISVSLQRLAGSSSDV